MLPHRGRRGYDVYAAGMEASAGEKAKLLPFVRPGVIADLGCGTGALLALLRKKFPKSSLIGVDLSEEMIDRCRARFPGVELQKLDITLGIFDDESLDTAILCSVLHEVYSYNDYDSGAVRSCLRHAAAALRRGGRLLLRDGLVPARDDLVFMSFRNEPTRDKFARFAREFGRSGIPYRQADGRVQLSRRDAMEFLTKYIYDVNWVYEVKEQFGVHTLKGWGDQVRAAGLRVVHQESYLIDWFRKTHWEKDVRLEVRAGRGYRTTSWPHSTMIVVGEK